MNTQSINNHLTLIRDSLNDIEKEISFPKKAKIIETIEKLAKPVPQEAIIEEMKIQGMDGSEILELLEILRYEGEIYQPKVNHWQVI
jgi:DNA replicative helicase MCM subunit Mcm2 (Cdc46/Mcm family)